MPAVRDRDPRIFLGPLEISGYYSALERGFHEQRVTARLVTLFPNPFGYTQATRNPWPARWAHRIVFRHRTVPAPLRVVTGGAFVLASLLLLIWALPRFSHFVFSWGTTLLPRQADLPLLRLFGKHVTVVVGHGSEARPPYMATPDAPVPLDESALVALARSSASIAARLRRLERGADIIIGLPTTSQFLERPFVDFMALGIPTPAAGAAAAPAGEAAAGEFVILHVPSKPEVKGTAQIREAARRVSDRTPGVRYVEISGRPHSEVLEAIRTASLVVDQLWSDIPMAVVGTEASAEGVPTLIGGYSWNVWRERLAPEATPPTFWFEPDQLESAIEERIADPDGTRKTGALARDFVTREWAPAAVASRYLQVLRGEAPAAWLVDPRSVVYGYGCGVSRENVDIMVSQLVDAYGIGSLRWRDAASAYHLETTPS
jgi:hypothetical protein